MPFDFNFFDRRPKTKSESEPVDIERLVERFENDENIVARARTIVLMIENDQPGQPNQQLEPALNELKTMIGDANLSNEDARSLAYALDRT